MKIFFSFSVPWEHFVKLDDLLKSLFYCVFSGTKILEPILEKVASAIRKSQHTDSQQNRILLSLGIIGIIGLVLSGLYAYIRNKFANRQQNVQANIPLDRI